MKKGIYALVALAVVLLLIAGGYTRMRVRGEQRAQLTIRLAQQYGMQYAPVYVVQKLGLLEELLPGVKLEWTNFGGGAAINEALISGQLDVGFMGTPPALIAIDKGADFRIALGIGVPPGELLVHPNSGINSIKDIEPKHKIAVPGLGSIQHIMLAIAAKEELGNANAFDNNLITMANPDAYLALIKGTDVIGHFAVMPYIDLELHAGMKSILTADDIGGGASIVCVTTKAFRENEKASNALLTALEQAIELINSEDEKAIQIIADTEKITFEAAKAYASWPGTRYTTELYRLNELAHFMRQTGYLTNDYKGFASVTWPTARAAKQTGASHGTD